jgi:hypothetical protein
MGECLDSVLYDFSKTVWFSLHVEKRGGLGVCFMPRRFDICVCFRLHTGKGRFLAFLYYEVPTTESLFVFKQKRKGGGRGLRRMIF